MSKDLNTMSLIELEEFVKSRKSDLNSLTTSDKITKSIGSPWGTWRVSTEGDCEGRTTKNLGVHGGHVADIALSLVNQVDRSLTFVKLSNTVSTKTLSRDVAVNIKLPGVTNGKCEDDVWCHWFECYEPPKTACRVTGIENDIKRATIKRVNS